MVRQRQTARVTNANVYDAIFQMDKGVSERFTAMTLSINGLGERMTAHDERHTASERASIVATEIKLDAKKVGIGAIFVSLLTVAAAALKSIMGC